MNTAHILQHLRRLAGDSEPPSALPEDARTVMLSRYQRLRPQGWFARLLGRPQHLEDTLQVQLRSALEEHARWDAPCDDLELLEHLPWHDLDCARSTLPEIAAAALHLVELHDARLDLGTPNDKPAILARVWTRKQQRILELARAEPSSQAWDSLTRALFILRRTDHLNELIPHLQHLLLSWPPDLKIPRHDWLELHIDPPWVNPRLAVCNPDVCTISHIELSPADYDQLAALTQSPHHTHLRTLTLKKGGAASGDDLVHLIARSPHLLHLHTLDLHRFDITADSLTTLAQWPGLASIKALYLYGGSVTHEAARAIVTSPHLHGNLKHLRFHNCTLTDKGAKHIASSPHMASLTHLGLHFNGLTRDGARALAQSPHLANLLDLDLSNNNNLGDAGLHALATSPHLSSLHTLNLASTSVTDSGWEIVKTPEFTLSALRNLDLSYHHDISFTTKIAMARWGQTHNIAFNLRPPGSTRG